MSSVFTKHLPSFRFAYTKHLLIKYPAVLQTFKHFISQTVNRKEGVIVIAIVASLHDSGLMLNLVTMTFQEIIHQDKPVLVDFFATWCGPCKTQSPILDDLKQRVGDTAAIIKIDVDKNQSVATQYQVRGVPTLIIFKNGEVRWRQSGVVPAEELEKLIKENL